MRCRQKRAKPGEMYRVKHCHSYPLPSGLEEGTIVKLISFDRGFWSVEADGQQFDGVFILSVEAGCLYELNGRWLDENDPRVVAEKKQRSLRSSPAYSCANSGCVNPPLEV